RIFRVGKGYSGSERGGAAKRCEFIMEQSFTESIVEEVALSLLTDLGFATASGSMVESDFSESERTNFTETFLARRVRGALAELNPTVSSDVLEEAFRTITLHREPSLVANNHAFHRHLIEGIAVECRRD